jgi:hypothetical protein
VTHKYLKYEHILMLKNSLDDLKSRSRSTIYIVALFRGVRSTHTKLEHLSLSISEDIVQKKTPYSWPILTLKVGQDQQYTGALHVKFEHFCLIIFEDIRQKPKID